MITGAYGGVQRWVGEPVKRHSPEQHSYCSGENPKEEEGGIRLFRAALCNAQRTLCMSNTFGVLSKENPKKLFKCGKNRPSSLKTALTVLAGDS